MNHTLPDFSYENAHEGVVCGIDEAGRGPWAGPVMAAAVIWPEDLAVPASLNDSKKLSAAKRDALYEYITANTHHALGIASVEEIDNSHILAATKLAMQRAYAGLNKICNIALIDGNQPPKLPCTAKAIIKGDSKSVSIAAASIIAKVSRDRYMHELAQHFPHYGFERHAGYGTKQHQEALTTHGVTIHHRRSFKPIRALLEETIAS